MNCNFDVFAKNFYNPSYPITPPKDYIYKFQRIVDIISCGRPLFYANFYNGDPLIKKRLPKLVNESWINNENWFVLKNSFRTLFNLCEIKICGKLDPKESNTETQNTHLVSQIKGSENVKFAIISAAIGIFSTPSLVDKKELVRNNMAWLVAADIRREGNMEITYASEGFFNSVMAKVLEQFTKSDPENLSLSFFEYANAKSFFHTGEIGEIVCRYIFLLAILRTKIVFLEDCHLLQADYVFDNITSMFYPKLVSNFLEQFVGKEIVQIFLDFCDSFYCKSTNSTHTRKIFSESLTTFSYFHRCKTVENPVGFTRNMLYRGCARITPAGHKGADFILPLVTGDNRLGNIMVQVKFVAKGYLTQKYYELKEEGRIREMRDLLKSFKEDKINPANILSYFKYTTNNIPNCPDFRKHITTFNLDKVFGSSDQKKKDEEASQSSPQNDFKADKNLPNPHKNMKSPLKSTPNPKGNLKAGKKILPESDGKDLTLEFDQKLSLDPPKEVKPDEPFPSLRIFVIIRENAQNVATIELDEFGPILLFETNGKHETFLKDSEQKMITSIIQKSRRDVPIQELEGQYGGGLLHSRMSDKPKNPIYFEELIDDDENKLKLKYFASWNSDLVKVFENRPKYTLEFDKLDYEIKESGETSESSLNTSNPAHNIKQKKSFFTSKAKSPLEKK
jgi:hypothetical protein